jgi:hypothetical protein
MSRQSRRFTLGRLRALRIADRDFDYTPLLTFARS